MTSGHALSFISCYRLVFYFRYHSASTAVGIVQSILNVFLSSLAITPLMFRNHYIHYTSIEKHLKVYLVVNLLSSSFPNIYFLRYFTSYAFSNYQYTFSFSRDVQKSNILQLNGCCNVAS